VEYPHLQEIFARRGGDDFTILSIETTNRPELARKFVDEVGAKFPIILDEKKEARNVFALQGVPTNLLIDREGRVVFRHLGFSEGHEKILDAEVQVLLDQNKETSQLLEN
jgi:hypothetical protein